MEVDNTNANRKINNMTAEEKAKELVETFGESILPVVYGSLLERDWGKAKECALIAVDEILFALKYDMNNPTSGSVQYWKKVKTEIQNL